MIRTFEELEAKQAQCAKCMEGKFKGESGKRAVVLCGGTGCLSSNSAEIQEKLKKLIERPLPTYVAGADIEDEVIFIAPAFDVNIIYNTIPPILKIDNVDKVRSKSDLEKLRDDIINYWNQANLPNFKKRYISTL